MPKTSEADKCYMTGLGRPTEIFGFFLPAPTQFSVWFCVFGYKKLRCNAECKFCMLI